MPADKNMRRGTQIDLGGRPLQSHAGESHIGASKTMGGIEGVDGGIYTQHAKAPICERVQLLPYIRYRGGSMTADNNMSRGNHIVLGGRRLQSHAGVSPDGADE